MLKLLLEKLRMSHSDAGATLLSCSSCMMLFEGREIGVTNFYHLMHYLVTFNTQFVDIDFSSPVLSVLLTGGAIELTLQEKQAESRASTAKNVQQALGGNLVIAVT